MWDVEPQCPANGSWMVHGVVGFAFFAENFEEPQKSRHLLSTVEVGEALTGPLRGRVSGSCGS